MGTGHISRVGRKGSFPGVHDIRCEDTYLQSLAWGSGRGQGGSHPVWIKPDVEGQDGLACLAVFGCSTTTPPPASSTHTLLVNGSSRLLPACPAGPLGQLLGRATGPQLDCKGPLPANCSPLAGSDLPLWVHLHHGVGWAARRGHGVWPCTPGQQQQRRQRRCRPSGSAAILGGHASPRAERAA